MGHGVMIRLRVFRAHLHRSFRHYLYGSLTVVILYFIYLHFAYRGERSRVRITDLDRFPVGHEFGGRFAKVPPPEEKFAKEIDMGGFLPDLFPRKGKEDEMGDIKGAVHEKETAGNVLAASFFIEAHCPDTTRFVHSQLWQAWQRLFATNRIVWTVVPFGKARCLPRGNSDFSCQCQHGPNECELNQLMNCAIDQLRYPSNYMPLINCIQGKADLLDARRQCLDGQQLVSVSRLLDCASGIEGRRLLARAGQVTMQLQPPLTFVPWITLDGVRSVDAMYDLTENLCNRLIPPPPQCL
uniref:GILT-like protein n=1 Tax=Ascaris suum TaxID=6253 RepID=F1LC97_ASCSU